MINDHIILQSRLIYFRKTCYVVRNLKKEIKPSPPKPLIQTHPNSLTCAPYPIHLFIFRTKEHCPYMRSKNKFLISSNLLTSLPISFDLINFYIFLL